jgi:Fe-S cluster assembly scaffold protein SufB
MTDKNNIKDVNTITNNLIILLAQLTECLNSETDALNANNRDKAAIKGKEKILLLQNYEVIAKDLKKDPNLLQDLDEGLKNHLNDKIQLFEEALKNNSTKVLSSKDAVQRLISRIMDRARETLKSPLQPYDATGQITSGKGSISGMPARLSEEL